MNRRSGHTRASAPPAFVLAVVLLVVAIAAMVATTAAILSTIPRTDAAAGQRRMQSRLLALAGVETISAALARQRVDLLAGLPLAPVPNNGTLFEEEMGQGVTRRGVWRVRAEIDGQGREMPLRAEATGLDLNHATGPMLASAGLSESAVAKVLALRASRRIGSWAEIAPHAGGADGSRFTVFAADAAEPNSVGAGAGAASRTPEDRVRLDRAWSDELEGELDEAVGDALLAHLREVIGKTAGLASDSDLVKALLARGVKPVDIGLVLARCSTRADGLGIRLGRVDVNHAPVEVVAAIPGFTPESAAAAVTRRAALPAEQGASPGWLLTEGVLDAEAFALAVDWISTRTLQFAVTIEAGVLVDDRARLEGESPLRDGITLRVVVDLAGREPRLSEVRDVTRAGAAPIIEPASATGAPPDPANEEPAESAPVGLPPPKRAGSLLDLEIPSRVTETPRQPTPKAPPKPPAPSRSPGRIGRWTTGG
ncbi:MAG: hypothetical protein ACT4PL_02440 [Phycisphaerales bacterium]